MRRSTPLAIVGLLLVVVGLVLALTVVFGDSKDRPNTAPSSVSTAAGLPETSQDAVSVQPDASSSVPLRSSTADSPPSSSDPIRPAPTPTVVPVPDSSLPDSRLPASSLVDQSSTTTAEDFVTVVAFGDTGVCSSEADSDVAELVRSLDPSTILMLGDLAYNDGTEQDFRDCWEPVWGEFESIVRAAPGNHDYRTNRAQPYLDRFFDGDETRWYSFSVGDWRVISYDSNCGIEERCAAESPQLSWIAEQMPAQDDACVLAFAHHPRFSSGYHGDTRRLEPIWEVFQAGGVDVVLSGHEHSFERFDVVNVQGERALDGIRQFVVGTGGAALREFPTVHEASVVRESSHGVLELRLRGDEYGWRFVAIDGRVLDEGSDTCRNPGT